MRRGSRNPRQLLPPETSRPRVLSVNGPMNDFYVYIYYEPGCEDPLYVGKGFGRRLSHHVKPGVVHGGKGPFYDKLRQLLESGSPPQIQVVANGLDEEEAHELERSLISRFGRRDLGTGCLLNRADGGPGMLNPSPAVRKEMSERAKNASEETRRKISEHHSGRPKTAEHRRKIGLAKKGVIHTRESRRKISDAKRSDPSNTQHCRDLAASQRTPVEAVCPDSGHVALSFPSQRAARRAGYNQGAISQCLRGRKRQYKGLRWRYAND